MGKANQDGFPRNLQFSELRYRRLFETAQDGILIIDAQSGKIIDANPFLKKILEYSQAELLGKELWQIGVFKDIVDSQVAFLELQKKGYIRYKDLPLQTKTGRKIDVEFISNVYMVDKQKVIQCNIRDIRERKKTEDEAKLRTKGLEKINKSQDETKRAMLNVMEDLQSAKAIIELEKVKDEAIFSSIGEGLIAIDNDLKIMVVNEALEEMIGWKKNELTGKHITTLRLEDDAGNLIPLGKRPSYLALSSGKATNSTYFFIRKDKTRFPIAVNVTPIKLEGKTIGLIETIRDVTREKEIDKAKSEFVSLASHQLRTPLGVIKWYLEVLQKDPFLKNAPKKIQQYFDEIYISNERVLSLVRDLLSVSRIEQGKVKDSPKLVDLIKEMNEFVEQIQILARKKKVQLTVTIKDKDIPLIKIDILRFREVIENLIGNAIEYTNQAGKVAVTVQRVTDTVVIDIKDNGIGISTRDQKKLFTKFFRSARAIVHNPEGSGLGLYVAKSYVQDWGGSISLQSAEGKGSTFTVTLPISPNKHI